MKSELTYLIEAIESLEGNIVITKEVFLDCVRSANIASDLDDQQIRDIPMEP